MILQSDSRNGKRGGKERKMSSKDCSVNNIYQLEGRVPLLKAIPFGLQHILAMFVANLTPITIIAAAGGLSQAEIAVLLQNAMFIAGIATLIQLYPVWKVGSGLPIVMGVSFTFVTVLCTVASNYGYPSVVGAVLVGGLFEGTLGLLAMTKVVNKFTIMTGAGCMILAGLLPPVGNFFASLPESVLGGCTIMMFGTIMTSGMQMLAKAGFNQRNVTIAALSLAVGVGFTAASEIDLWHIFPEIVQSVFSANVVAVAFVVSIILNLVLPKNMDVDKISE